MKRATLALLLILAAGCTSTLQGKLMRVREVKYAADTMFSEQVDSMLKLADEGWKAKFALQKLTIENVYADRVRNTTKDYAQDAAGQPTAGTIDLVKMLKILSARDKDLSALAAAQKQYDVARTAAADSLLAYRNANERTYKLESDAHDALMSAQAQIDSALKALSGVMAAAAVAASAL